MILDFVFMLIISLLMVSAITLDIPIDNDYLPTVNPFLNATNNLTKANVSFFVTNGTDFSDSTIDYEVCTFINTSQENLNCTFVAINKVLSINSIDFYMKMDEHTGNTTDSVGSMDVNANKVGEPAYLVQGGVTNGYFNYTTNGVYHRDSSPSITVTHLDDFTYGAWIRVKDPFCTPGSSNFAGVHGPPFNTYTSFGRTNSVALNWDDVYINMDDASCRSGAGIICNEWVFIVGTWHNSHVCKTYVNGVQRCSSTCWDGNGISVNVIWQVGSFIGGTRADIDEVWFDKGTNWSQADIQAAYAFGEGTYYWKVNGTNASDIANSSVRNFTLDITPPVIEINLTDNFTTDSTLDYFINATDLNPFNISLNVNQVIIQNEMENNITGTQSLIFGTNNFIGKVVDLAGNQAFAQAILIKTGWTNISKRYYADRNVTIKYYADRNISVRVYG